MREHIICPDCGNEFSLDVEQARTEVLCPRCRKEFVYVSEAIPPDEEVVPMDEDVDASAETVELPDKQAANGKSAKPEEEIAQPGMTIGNYEIVEEIARGAVGVVYKARQKNLNRVVALKVLLAGQAASEEQIQRFHQEALAVAKLRHPNIVPVYDVGVFEGKHYIAMEYVDGRPLHHLMKSKRFTPNEALDIILKVSDAIAHAHKHGIIHRDIKPANIMMDDSGRVQVMDFGLAKEVEADAQFTRSGTTMGTPNYMPVEQAQGDNKNIDERSDIYSLGAVLYEMLTGVPPFVADTNLKTILKVINEEPLPPRRRNPYIHRDIETICEKAIEKDKTRRYDTVQAFMDDIERFKTGEPIQARPPSTAYRISKKIRKHAAVIAASLGTIIVAVAVLTLYRVIFPPPPQSPPVAYTAPAKTALIYTLVFPDKSALENMAAKEVYLTDAGLDAHLPEGGLPEQISTSLDIPVTRNATGWLSLCLYARTDKPTADNYYAGLAATLHFSNGSLKQVVFKGNDRYTMDMPVQPEGGVFHVRLWRERKDEDKLYLSVNKKYLTWKIDGMPAKTGNGVGIAVLGTGIDFGPVVLDEVIPPWETLVKAADDLFKSNTAYASAQKVYEKAFREYASDPQAKIPEAELARVQLNIAICMAHQAGLYSDNPPKPGQFDAAKSALREVMTKYAANYPAIAESADTRLLHIRFLTEDIDLKKEAEALVQKYPDLKVEDVIKDVFSRFPPSVLVQRTPTDVATLDILAQHYLDAGNLEEACEVLLQVAKDYEAKSDFTNALSQYERIITKIDFSKQPETGDYYKKLARILRAQVFLASGDFEKYDREANNVLYLYEKRLPEQGTFVFDPDLAKLKVEWGTNLFTRWFANTSRKTTDDYVQRSYKILSECLLYAEPPVGPKPSPDDKAQYDRWLRESMQNEIWQVMIERAGAELVPVAYALDRPSAEIYRYFQGFIGIARERRVKLIELASEAFARSGEYTRARRLSYEIINNFRDLTYASLKAVNTLAGTYVQQGMDKRGDAGDVNMKELANALTILDSIDAKERPDVELKVDALLKAAFTDFVKYVQHGLERDDTGAVKIGPDGEPIVTEAGNEIRKEASYLWDKIKATSDAGGLESDSYIRRILQTMDSNTTPDQLNTVEKSISTEKNPEKRGEMKMALGLRYYFSLSKTEQEKGKAMLEEVLKDDPLRQYWFTRFLEEYLKEKHEPVPPIDNKA